MATPIKDAVQATISQIGTHTFVFGNMFEANLSLDQLTPADFPVAIFIPPLEYADNWSSSSALNNTTTIRVLFMDRVGEEVDPTAEQANEIIETQLLASRQFWQTLGTNNVVREIDTVNHEALFSDFDARLFGVAGEAAAELYLQQPGCIPFDEANVAQPANVAINGRNIVGLPPGQAGKSILIGDEFFTLISDTLIDGDPVVGDGNYIVYYGEDYGAFINANLAPGGNLTLPQGEYLVRTQIDGVNNDVLRGTLDRDGKRLTTLIKTTHSYDPTVERPPNGEIIASFIHAQEVDGFEIRDLNFRNVGYEEGDPSDFNYYTELNGVPVTYNRRQNKRVNFGGAIYCNQAKNIRITNCETWNMNLVNNSGSDNVYVADNRCNASGEVMIYPARNSIVENNVLLQDAPELSQDDINNDLGTSHLVYVTSSYENVTFRNNTVKGARVNGIQFNTVAGTSWNNELVEGNIFEDCFRAFFVGGTNALLEGDLTYRNNRVINCGTLWELFATNCDIVIENNLFDGNGYGRISTGFERMKSTIVRSNTFRNRNTFTNDSGLRIIFGDEMGDLTVTGNIFEESMNFAIRVETPSGPYSGTCLIDDNDFLSSFRYGTDSGEDDEGAASQVTVSNNNFDVNSATAFVINFGLLFTGNSVNCENNQGFVVVNIITNDEAVLDGNTWNGSDLGVSATASNGNYSFINNVSNGPTWNQGTNPPNRDENNTGF